MSEQDLLTRAMKRAVQLLEDVKAAKRTDRQIRASLIQAYLDGAEYATLVRPAGGRKPKPLGGGAIENQALGLVPMVLRLRPDLEPPGRILVSDESGDIDEILMRAREPELWTWLSLQGPGDVYVLGAYDYQVQRLHIEPRIAEGASW